MEKDAKTREKEATFPNFRDGNCSGIVEKIFRSNERITSLEQVGTTSWKSCEGRGGLSLCMVRSKRNSSSPVSLCSYTATRAHTYAHTRAHFHTYIHTVPSFYESLSLPVCITFFLCVSIAQAHRGPAVVQVQYSTQKFPSSLHKDTLGVSLSFLVPLSARMRSPSSWRGGGGSVAI